LVSGLHSDLPASTGLRAVGFDGQDDSARGPDTIPGWFALTSSRMGIRISFIYLQFQVVRGDVRTVDPALRWHLNQVWKGGLVVLLPLGAF
jgi:hypothetical protein